MSKRPFDDEMLGCLVRDYGFGSEGNPKAAARFLHKILSLCPFYDHRPELEALLPDRGLEYLVLYMVGALDVIEHGGGIGGSWLTSDKGEPLLEKLDAIDWRASPVVAGTFISTVVPKRNWDERNLYDRVAIPMHFCGCGQPMSAMAKLLPLLQAASVKDDGPWQSTFPDEGMRQFMLYRMINLGILLPCGAGLSESGQRVLTTLLQLQGQDWEYDEYEFDDQVPK